MTPVTPPKSAANDFPGAGEFVPPRIDNGVNPEDGEQPKKNGDFEDAAKLAPPGKENETIDEEQEEQQPLNEETMDATVTVANSTTTDDGPADITIEEEQALQQPSTPNAAKVDEPPKSQVDFASQIMISSTPKRTPPPATEDEGANEKNKEVVPVPAKTPTSRAAADLPLKPTKRARRESTGKKQKVKKPPRSFKPGDDLYLSSSEEEKEDEVDKTEELIETDEEEEEEGGRAKKKRADENNNEENSEVELEDSQRELEQSQHGGGSQFDFMDENEEPTFATQPTVAIRAAPLTKAKALKKQGISPEETEEMVAKLRAEVLGMLADNNVKRGAFVDTRTNFLQILNNEDETREEKEARAHRNAKLASVVEHAERVLEESKKAEKECRSVAGKQKLREATKKHEAEVSAAIVASHKGIKEKLSLVDVRKIAYSTKARAPCPLAIASIQRDLLDGFQVPLDMIIRVARTADGFILADGRQRVEAYKGLASMVKDAYSDKYDDDGEDEEGVPTSSTQPAPTAPPTALPPRAALSQEPLQKKKPNPFLKIPALVIEDAPKTLDLEYCAMFKANEANKGKPLSAIEQVRMVRTMSESMYKDRKGFPKTADAHYKDLKELIRCTKADVRVVRELPKKKEGKVYDLLMAHTALNNMTFINACTSALKICQKTADNAIDLMMSGMETPEEGQLIINEHSKRVVYLFMGLNCDYETSSEIESRLEPGKRTFTGVNYHMQLNRRLDHNALVAKDRDVEKILMELEREMLPCIGFTTANVIHRAVNDGEDCSRCLLNIIDFNDFVKNVRIFDDVVKLDKPSKFIIVEESAVPATEKRVYHERVKAVLAHANTGVASFMFHVVPIDERKILIKESTKTVPCVLLAGKKGVWSSLNEIRREMNDYGVHNYVDNEHLRRMIYGQHKPALDTADKEKYNTVFLHSGTPNVVGIVANLALNRVLTSLTGDALEKLETDLNELQKIRTAEGDAILKKEHSNKKEVKGKKKD